MNLIEFLKKESYPGRAIVVGKKNCLLLDYGQK